MSDAKTILDERLAKGEILEEEYDRLLKKLSSVAPQDKRQPKSENLAQDTVATPTRTRKNGWTGWVIIAAIGLGVVMFVGSLKQGRTHINNLRSSGFFGDVISGELVTEGKSGKVYVWIEKGGKRMCPRSVFLQKNKPRRFQFQCSQMNSASGSRFTMKTNRYPDDWVLKRSKSL